MFYCFVSFTAKIKRIVLETESPDTRIFNASNGRLFFAVVVLTLEHSILRQFPVPTLSCAFYFKKKRFQEKAMSRRRRASFSDDEDDSKFIVNSLFRKVALSNTLQRVKSSNKVCDKSEFLPSLCCLHRSKLISVLVPIWGFRARFQG